MAQGRPNGQRVPPVPGTGPGVPATCGGGAGTRVPEDSGALGGGRPGRGVPCGLQVGPAWVSSPSERELFSQPAAPQTYRLLLQTKH